MVTLVNQITNNADGSVSRQLGIIPPANLFGFSEDVLSAQAYYDIGAFDFQVIYKYRSEYFQQFISTPNNIRYIDARGIWEARISYKFSKNISFKLEGINLGNTARVQYNPTLENLSEVNSYGPRYFLGVRAKF